MPSARFAVLGLIAGLSSTSFGCEPDEEGEERGPVWPGSLTLGGSDGEELARLKGVEVITGDLRLTAVASLNALSSLLQVQGDLVITESPDLQSLEGLERLESVGGNFRMSGVMNLSSLEGLTALAEIGGSLELRGLSTTDLRGLGGLRRIGGDLRVDGNPGLDSLSGLDRLTAVQGSLEVGGNDALTSMRLGAADGAGPSISGHVHVIRNPELRTLESFGHLSAREGGCAVGRSDIWVSSNEQLESIDFPSLIARRICVDIFNNPRLHTLAGGDVNPWDTLTLLDLPSLSTVDLPIQEVRKVTISKTGLTSLGGFGKVSCGLDVSNNPRLSSLGDYAKYPGQVAERIAVRDNASLPQCAVDAMLSGLREPTIRCVDPIAWTSPLTRVVEGKNNDGSAVCAPPM